MKKTLLVLSAIATLFAFVSCKKSTGDDTPTLEDLVIYQAEGEEYVLECIADYNNILPLIAPVAAGSGYKKIYAEVKYEATGDTQAALQLMNGTAEDNSDMGQASATVSIGKDYSTVSGDCLKGASYSKWVDGAPQPTPCEDTATKLQFYIQDKAAGYNPCAGKIYIKKVWLSAK